MTKEEADQIVLENTNIKGKEIIFEKEPWLILDVYSYQISDKEYAVKISLKQLPSRNTELSFLDVEDFKAFQI